MLNEIIAKISAVKLTPLNPHQPIYEPTLRISMANVIGDHAIERRPRDVRIIPAAQGTIFMMVTLYPSK
uniref:Uncharacterized protein n=1 Tax=Romanomermis culicivorax TaxID=13658 RepID=A0A915I789_ROMCU